MWKGSAVKDKRKRENKEPNEGAKAKIKGVVKVRNWNFNLHNCKKGRVEQIKRENIKGGRIDETNRVVDQWE